MAAASFFALAYTFYDNAHIRITLFLEKLKDKKRRFAEIWCLISRQVSFQALWPITLSKW